MLVYELFGYSGMGCTATDLILVHPALLLDLTGANVVDIS